MQARASEEHRRPRAAAGELRNERGLTLQQVAEGASIDVSTLSRLESGAPACARPYPGPGVGVTVSADELLGTRPPEDLRIRSRPRTHQGLTMWPLTRREASGGLRAYKIHISERRRKPPRTLPVHEGSDWLYVLSGRLRPLLGEQDLAIEPGDAVEFSTWTPHCSAPSTGRSSWIMIFGPQGGADPPTPRFTPASPGGRRRLRAAAPAAGSAATGPRNWWCDESRRWRAGG